MHAIKSDGFALNGSTNVASEAAQYVSLWCTAAVTSGDWIAVHAGDTTNPAGQAGDSFRTADVDNSDALYDTVGVCQQTTTAAGYALVQVRGWCQNANVASGASGVIAISATAGRAEDYAGTNPELRPLGTTQAAASGNLANVYLNVHPRFAE